MAADSVSPTRTISLGDMKPDELAYLFARMDSNEQAHFFNRVAVETREWPGTGWCYQCAHIIDALSDEGARVVTTLAGHIQDRQAAPSLDLLKELVEALNGFESGGGALEFAEAVRAVLLKAQQPVERSDVEDPARREKFRRDMARMEDPVLGRFEDHPTFIPNSTKDDDQ